MNNKYYKYFCMLLILICVVGSRKTYAEMEEVKYVNIILTRPRIEKKLINLNSENGFAIYSIDDKINPIFSIDNNEIKVVLDEMENITLLGSLEDILFTIPRESDLVLKALGNEESLIKVEKDRYRGYLKFKVKNGDIILINHIETEHYLYGLVPKEMPYSFPSEALKAQAVAARTYATYNMGKHLNEGYNLCDTTHCQVYSGYESENFLTSKAVDDTKGILAYYEGKPINAQYHSTSSGFTENSSDVWGGNLPYLISVRDDFSLDAPLSNWSIKIDTFELNKKLILNGINIGLIDGVQVIESSPNGSVKKVKLVGTNGEEIITGSKFRSIVGNTTLKSTYFDISGGNILNVDREVFIIGKSGERVSKKISEISVLDKGIRKPVSRGTTSTSINKDNKIGELFSGQNIYHTPTSELIIEGRGYGHGVGMSQYGAKKMAEDGYTFEEILKHYYTGIDIL